MILVYSWILWFYLSLCFPLNFFRNMAISEWLVGFRFLNYLLRKQYSSFCDEISLHFFFYGSCDIEMRLKWWIAVETNSFIYINIKNWNNFTDYLEQVTQSKGSVLMTSCWVKANLCAKRQLSMHDLVSVLIHWMLLINYNY